MENASGNGGAEAALGITPDTGFAAVDTENILATERGTAPAAFAVAWSTKPTAAAFVLIPIGEVTIIAVAPNAAKTSVVMRQSSFSCIETNTAAGAMRAIGQVVAALLFRDEIGPKMGAFGPLRYSAYSEANTRIKGRVYASKSRFW